MPKRTRADLAAQLVDSGRDFLITRNARRKTSPHLPLPLLQRAVASLESNSPPPEGVMSLILSNAAFWDTFQYEEGKEGLRSLSLLSRLARVCREMRMTPGFLWNVALEGLAAVRVRKSWCEKKLLMKRNEICKLPSYAISFGGYGERCYEYGLVTVRDLKALLSRVYGTSITSIVDGVEHRRKERDARPPRRYTIRHSPARHTQNDFNEYESETEGTDERRTALRDTLMTVHAFKDKWCKGYLFNYFVRDGDDMDLESCAQEIAFRRYLHMHTDYNQQADREFARTGGYTGLHKRMRDQVRQQIEASGGLPAVWPWTVNP